jgi:hypothetical protein
MTVDHVPDFEEAAASTVEVVGRAPRREDWREGSQE